VGSRIGERRASALNLGYSDIPRYNPNIFCLEQVNYSGESEMIKEFKEFILRGNVIDLAVAFIIGGAFGAVVASLVKDIVMPVVAAVFGKPDFSALAFTIGVSAITYGAFLNAVINFLIVAFAMFLVVKAANARKKSAPAAVPMTKDCPYCLSAVPLKATRCPNCTSELKA
jgi:large conductance mechanosensitive channel